MHNGQHVIVRRCRRCRLGICYDMRRVGITCLRKMRFVSHPGNVTLLAITGVWIMGRGDLLGGCGHLLHGTPPKAPVLLDVLRVPDLAKNMNCRQLCQPWLLHRRIDRSQQLTTIGADDDGQCEALRVSFWQAIVLHATGERSYQTGGARACSQSGATTASWFKAARMVSPTRSSRLSPRTAASTCVESVRWRPLAFTRPSSRKHCRRASRSSRSALPSIRRERNSLSTVRSKPGSVSDRPRTYFQSIR